MSGGQDSTYSNCVPQGLVAIIQRNNTLSPDGSGKGGYILFEFRQPIDFVKALTVLDMKNKPHLPWVELYFNNGASVTRIDIPDTGSNGVYTLPFRTSLYMNVTAMAVHYANQGAVGSMEYPYCAKTPASKISLKKYAGLPNSCNASGISCMQDDTFTTTTVTSANGTITYAQWAYCYVISIPPDSEDCVYDAILTDPAPIGGTRGKRIITTT